MQCYRKEYHHKNSERINAARRIRFKENGHVYDTYLKSTYGISREEYARLFELQDGKCAICGQVSENRRLSVDHNHTTGKVRALLCDNCNKGLGHFKDNPNLLIAAASYLNSVV